MKKRVLVAEDDINVAFLIKDGLADLGADFDVETVSSGEEALAKIDQDKWDLVVTDHRMPGMTGLELIEALKQKVPAALSILMTAYGSEDVELAAQRLNVYHYMTKPFPLVDLKRVIEQALAYKAGGEPSSGSNEKDTSPTFKITLGGDGNVGKTTLIKRLCTGRFDASRVMTIGVDFHLYDVQSQNQAARLIVWDVSGQPHFAFTRRAFYRGSKAVGLVYNAMDRQSFERLHEWHHEIRSILPNVPFVIAGNKVDLGRQVSTEEASALAQSWNVPFFETSCLTGANVDEFFKALADAATRRIMNPSFSRRD
ncbi:MAG: GTP-binding protein [Chloroflexi bacterium]|nr:GTP-binding protein [Chloroflexota bacterium]